jgi:carboxypeptidase C (cathepsin A)
VIDSGATHFHKNPYSWNREANMLYIESPAGVGFSYCGELGGCNFTDDSSASDNLDAVLGWYAKFPEFKTNDLYISGESYAGIYVPYLAYEIYIHK